MSNPVQKLINESAMSSAQIIAIGICILLNMMDGFDILVMSFTASPVSQEWQLENSTLGLLLSAGLFGMAAGALFLSSYADKLGRKTMIIFCLTIMGSGMLISGFTQNYVQLGVVRFITGIGIGGMIASLNTIVAEFSSEKRRSFSVTLLQTGNPIGGVLGGLVAVYLIANYGWRSAFIVGGIASLALLPLVLWKLPESLSFLTNTQPKGALEKVNKILLSFGHKSIAKLPAKPKTDIQNNTGVKTLFAPGKSSSTLYLWLAFFMIMFSFYFIMSWTPKLLVQAGLSTSAGISGSIILNLGGIIGAPILGFLAAKRKLQTLIGSYMFATALLMVVFGFLTSNFFPALFVAIFLGFFLFGSIIGLYALAPNVYDVNNRAAGIGYAIGIGRIGAVLAPFVAGTLLDANLSVPVLFTIFAIPMLVCMIAQHKIKTL